MKKILFIFIVILAFSCNNTTPTNSETVVNEGPTWNKNFYTDDFGDPTENSYMSVQVDGVFSNSATVNSKLTVVIMVDGDFLNIQLYEYGDEPFKSFDSGTGGIMKFKVGDEVITVNTIYDANDAGVTSTDLMIWEKGVSITKNVTSYLSKLVGKENVKCVISINETYGGESSYSFIMPTNGLDIVLKSIK